MQSRVVKVRFTSIPKLPFPADREPVFVSLAVDVDPSHCSRFGLEFSKKDYIDRQVETFGAARHPDMTP